MNRRAMLPMAASVPPDASTRCEPDLPPPVEHPGTASEPVDHSASSHSFEGFLTEVEHCVRDAGQLLLFAGEDLRLEVMLLRHEKNPRVIWGLKQHEDWAFKATLLRFARGREPVHLVLSTEHESGYRIRGWVVKRSWDAFWAAPLPPEQTQGFWERCLRPFSLEKILASVESDRAEPAPHPEPPTQS